MSLDAGAPPRRGPARPWPLLPPRVHPVWWGFLSAGEALFDWTA